HFATEGTPNMGWNLTLLVLLLLPLILALFSCWGLGCIVLLILLAYVFFGLFIPKLLCWLSLFLGDICVIYSRLRNVLLFSKVRIFWYLVRHVLESYLSCWSPGSGFFRHREGWYVFIRFLLSVDLIVYATPNHSIIQINCINLLFIFGVTYILIDILLV